MILTKKDAPMISRTDIIQKIIDKKSARTYLEIGVDSGDNFFKIRVARKIAVDIKFSFLFSRYGKTLKRYFQNLRSNFFNRYYQMSSDNFF